MTIACSISLIPHKLISSAFYHHNFINFRCVFVNSSNVRRPQQQKPHKSLLKARENIKRQLSSLPPVLSPNQTPTLTQDQAIGTVASSQANFMRVVVSSHNSGVELLCVVKAVLKKIKTRVLVGDEVLVGGIDWVDRRGMIENVFQRKSEIMDPPVANVDHLLVLFSLEQPKIEPIVLTRFLVEAESTGIPLTLAINKAELVDEPALKEWKSRLRGWGYDAVFCSVDTGTGLDTLKLILRDQTSVIVGPSGVGKSSLINALREHKSDIGATDDDSWFDNILGSKWLEEQRVGEVSVRSGRGKHTTRHVSLLPLSEGGFLADTPGFSQPSLMKVTKQSLAQHFPEIRKMMDNGSGKCSFSNCLHLGEPGCLVQGDWERYAYYLELLDEIKIREAFELRTVGTKRESNVRLKAVGMGVEHAEPRLEMKKHRRQSRKRVNQSLLDDLEDDEDEILDDMNTEENLEGDGEK